MLSIPRAGWTRVQVGDFSDRASYLDDVPVMVLQGFITYYTTINPFCVEFDAEGYGWILIANHMDSMVVYCDKVINLTISAESLAEEVIKDIEDNLEDWCRWNPCSDEESGYKKSNMEIMNLLTRLKKVKKGHEDTVKYTYQQMLNRRGF